MELIDVFIDGCIPLHQQQQFFKQHFFIVNGQVFLLQFHLHLFQVSNRWLMKSVQVLFHDLPPHSGLTFQFHFFEVHTTIGCNPKPIEVVFQGVVPVLKGIWILFPKKIKHVHTHLVHGVIMAVIQSLLDSGRSSCTVGNSLPLHTS